MARLPLLNQLQQQNETIEIDGVEYPLVKWKSPTLHIPFYTGKVKLVDTAGRVDKFMNRYKDHMEKRKK